MGFKDNIRVLSPLAWLERPEIKSAKPKSAPARRAPLYASEAQTPQDALVYIEGLYKSGRMEELGALLRRSSVFREAWLALQQGTPDGRGGSGTPQIFPLSPGKAPTAEGQNPPPVEAENTAPNPGQGLEEARIPAAPAVSPKWPGDPGDVRLPDFPVPSSRPHSPLALARQVYERQQRFFSQETDPTPRFSLKV